MNQQNSQQNATHDLIFSELATAKVLEGPLLKRSKFLKQWRERWVVLTHTYIATFTDSTCKDLTEYMDLKQVRSYKSYIKNNQEMMPICFKIRSNQNAFYFTAKDTDQKWLWILAIERTFDFRYQGIKAYQSPQAIKKLGFPSIEEYFQKGKHKIGVVESYKSKAQQRQLLIFKQELAKQQKVIQQQKHKLTQQRSKLQQKIARIIAENNKLKEKLKELNVVVQQESNQQEFQAEARSIMEELFQELKRNQSYKVKENILDFMAKLIILDPSYQQKLVIKLKQKDNNIFFIQFLDQYLKDFLQMNRCESIVCLIKVILQDLSKHIKSSQLKAIKNKLLQFLKNNSTRSIDIITKILQAMKAMDLISKYYRNQQLQSIIYVIKQSNRQSVTQQLKQLIKHFQE